MVGPEEKAAEKKAQKVRKAQLTEIRDFIRLKVLKYGKGLVAYFVGDFNIDGMPREGDGRSN